MTRGWQAGRALFADFRRQAGSRLLAAVALLVAGVAVEGIGILLLLPILAVAIDDGTAVRELPIFREFGAITADAGFAGLVTAFAAMMIGRAVLLYRRDLALASLHADYEASLRIRAAATLAGLGWQRASQIAQSRMHALLATDIPRAALAVHYGQAIVVAAVLLASQVALAYLLSPTLALAALALIMLGLVASWRWVRAGKRSGVEITEGIAESSGAGFRLHTGLKPALAEGQASNFVAEYSRSLDHVKQRTLRFVVDQAQARAAAAVAAAVAAALMLVIGHRVLELPLPVLITALILFARMTGPAQQLQQSAQLLAGFVPSFAVIGAVLGDFRVPAAAEACPAMAGWRQFRLDGVTFRYPGGSGVENVTISLGAGEWLGLGGPSGAGKTTIVDLVAGLIDPQSGQREIDGAEIEGATLEQWRRGLAYVGQEPFLFQDSLRNNLAWGTDGASDAEMAEALRRVGAQTLIDSMPDGLGTFIGERGARLSGGERQRIALARALLRRPALLILDEATSALDLAAERSVIEAIRALNPRPAAIVVAHRGETLALCDRVIRLDDGAAAQ